MALPNSWKSIVEKLTGQQWVQPKKVKDALDSVP
jgi:hypothetical protein